MNALVGFRANALGTQVPTRTQRTEAQKEIAATFRAKLDGVRRRMIATQEQAHLKNAPADVKQVAAPQTKQQAESAPAQEELGREAFLNLLVLQMQHQDPTSPVDNEDMIAQLAQFSSLEQMENLNGSFSEMNEQFTAFSGNLDQLNFISAQGLLGREVEGVTPDGGVFAGTVESVHLQGSIVMLTVDDAQVPMTGVTGVSTTSAGNQQGEAGAGEKSLLDKLQVWK